MGKAHVTRAACGHTRRVRRRAAPSFITGLFRGKNLVQLLAESGVAVRFSMFSGSLGLGHKALQKENLKFFLEGYQR